MDDDNFAYAQMIEARLELARRFLMLIDLDDMKGVPTDLLRAYVSFTEMAEYMDKISDEERDIYFREGVKNSSSIRKILEDREKTDG